MRLIAIFLLVAATVTITSSSLVHQARPARSTELIGDTWRLPWAAGVSHHVGGNGYDDPGPPRTHTGTEIYALDFNIPEGDYEMAAQEGDVKSLNVDSQCGPTKQGTFVEIADVNGFRHKYQHLSSTSWHLNDHLYPGWVVGRSGHTGYTDCTVSGAHLH